MKITDKYIALIAIISVVVGLLMHFPEIVSLVDDDPSNLFPDMEATDVAAEVIFVILSLAALFYLNMLVFGYDKLSGHLSWGKLLLSFIFTWLLSNMLGNGFFFLHHYWGIPAVDATTHHYLHPLRDFIISCIVVGSCYIIYLTRYSQRVQSENQQLQAESLLNQYEALKNQLNPHMLFNSLNTLRSLIRETPVKAQEYVQELSRVLRYTLQENEQQSVVLGEEMKFVHSFIFLLKMRYEDNLTFDIQVPKEDEARHLPPMSVQLLVENAVKHNEISNRRPLTVRLYSNGQYLTVSNPIQPKRTAYVGAGIGLANLAKRYELLYKKDIDVKKENGMFSVTIPLI